jgi:hypothetical protein
MIHCHISCGTTVYIQVTDEYHREDMQGIIDPVINKILSMVDEQVNEAKLVRGKKIEACAGTAK